MAKTHIIEIKSIPKPRKHTPVRSGAGKHEDKRTKRNRTRLSQEKKALGDWK